MSLRDSERKLLEETPVLPLGLARLPARARLQPDSHKPTEGIGDELDVPVLISESTLHPIESAEQHRQVAARVEVLRESRFHDRALGDPARRAVAREPFSKGCGETRPNPNPPHTRPTALIHFCRSLLLRRAHAFAHSQLPPPIQRTDTKPPLMFSADFDRPSREPSELRRCAHQNEPAPVADHGERRPLGPHLEPPPKAVRNVRQKHPTGAGGHPLSYRPTLELRGERDARPHVRAATRADDLAPPFEGTADVQPETIRRERVGIHAIQPDGAGLRDLRF